MSSRDHPIADLVENIMDTILGEGSCLLMSEKAWTTARGYSDVEGRDFGKIFPFGEN